MSEALPPTARPSSGRRFELIERIGSGAFGEVFLANLVSGAGFSRAVALKLLHPDRFDEDDAARRIRDEARVLGRLHHPHIVTVMDLVRLDTQWAVVMEHVEGADLEHVLLALDKAGRVFPAAAVLELVSHVADALDAAYNAEGPDGGPLRVVHRDVKPANLRLTPNGDIKVLDFGIARARMPSREAQTGAYVIGTQRYMSPERIAGRDQGPHGDVYGLAATAYELLAGTPLGRSPVLADRHEVWLRERLLALDGVLVGPVEVRQRVAGLLYECLSGEPLDRPRAADLSERAAALARQLPGEDLRAFSRRFVPQVSTLLGRVPDRVNRVLTEWTTGSVSLGEPGTLRQARTEPETSEVRRPFIVLPALAAMSVVVVAGLAVLALGVVGGVLTWLVLRSAPVVPAEESMEPAALGAESGEHGEAGEPAQQPAGALDEGAVLPDLNASPGPVELQAVPTRPSPRPQPKAAPRVEAPTEPEPVEPPVDAPTVSRAQVVVAGANGMSVTCGAVRAAGTGSARIMGFPAGDCVVSAVVEGRELTGPATLLAPRTVSCVADEGALRCD